MDQKKHYAAAVAAFVVWGFFSIPLRALSAYSAGEILYFRIIFSVVILWGIIAAFRRRAWQNVWSTFRSLTPAQQRQTVLLTLAGGALLTVNWLTFIYIVNHINIKTASFSYLICPVITAVLGYVLLQEKLTSLQWVAVALCALSCVLMGMNAALELGYSLLTAFTYALYLITQRRVQGYDRIVMLGIQVTFACLVLSLMVPLLVQQVPSSPSFYGIILVIAVVFTVLPLFLNLFALNKINSATIGILMYLNPLINFTLAFVWFGEPITTVQVAGYAIIAVALVLFNYHTVRRLQASVLARP